MVKVVETHVEVELLYVLVTGQVVSVVYVVYVTVPGEAGAELYRQRRPAQ